MTFEQVKGICQEQLGNVVVSDLGFQAPGLWQVQIIVGSKENPAYNPVDDPNSALYDQQKKQMPDGFKNKFVADVRVINLNGAEGYNEIVNKLQKIKNTLPENREIPEYVFIKAEPRAEEATKSNQEDVNKLTKGVPEAPKKGQDEMMQGFMEDVMGILKEISDRVSALEVKNEIIPEPRENKDSGVPSL